MQYGLICVHTCTYVCMHIWTRCKCGCMQGWDARHTSNILGAQHTSHAQAAHHSRCRTLEFVHHDCNIMSFLTIQIACPLMIAQELGAHFVTPSAPPFGHPCNTRPQSLHSLNVQGYLRALTFVIAVKALSLTANTGHAQTLAGHGPWLVNNYMANAM